MPMILTVLQLLLSLGLIGLVLIQHGRGADAGAAFGSGASSTVFGARGSGSFLSRATAVLAALFFLTSMALAYYAAQTAQVEDLMDGVVAEEPAVPVEAPQVDLPPVPVSAPGGADVPVVPAAVPDVPAASSQPAKTGGTPSDVPDVPAAGSDRAGQTGEDEGAK